MAAERSPTGRVIEQLWQRWAKRFHGQHGRVVSKREVSMNYFESPCDPHMLARWSSAAKRRDWRFPLTRLTELAVTLELSMADVDELMTARIEELQDDPETMTLLTWLAGFLERTALTAEERDVVQAWRSARKYSPLGIYNDGRAPQELQRLFEEFLAQQQRRHESDQQEASAYEQATTPMRRHEVHESARALRMGNQTVPAPLVRAKDETLALMRRLRQGKRRVGVAGQ